MQARVPTASLSLASGGDCEPSWQPTFGVRPGADAAIRAVAMFDDGSGAGPLVHAGGDFTQASGAPAIRVARFDGTRWTNLGSGVNDTVLALVVFDDGNGDGEALYAAGEFTTAGGTPANHVARWDGTSWSPLGPGLDDTILALTVFDAGDGNGPALVAGGVFSNAGATTTTRIAKWDGTSWSALGTGVGGAVRALAVFDEGDGGGPALHAGGDFASAGGTPAANIAKWNGTVWSPLGFGRNSTVHALAVFDDGSAPALYVAGSFNQNGSRHIARWNGSTWSGLPGNGTERFINALAAFDDGNGPALFVGGEMLTAGGVPVSRIAKFDGTNWSSPGSGVYGESFSSLVRVYAFAGVPAGSGGPRLWVAGEFTVAGGAGAGHVAAWNGSSWSSFETGFDNSVLALASFDGGGGPELHAGGDFESAGGNVLAKKIAKWNGTSWEGLGSGMNASVRVMTAFDDGGGPALYAGGDFTSAGGVPASRIARWDGASWSALGTGILGEVYALRVFDDGGGPALYAGGDFVIAGGVVVNSIAKWDGTSWSGLGGGVDVFGDPIVFALRNYNDGNGIALYAGGHFTAAGGIQALGIAKWNGASWSSVGSSLYNSAGNEGIVRAMTLFGSGDGLKLQVGGDFFRSGGGQTLRNVGAWDGATWSPLGSGVQTGSIRSMAVFGDGSGAGPALYVSGFLGTAGGLGVNGIARWDGASWSSPGNGMNDAVKALLPFDDGSGTGALYAGGDFTSAFDSGDSYLARFEGCTDTTPPTLFCPTRVVKGDPIGGPPGEIVTFTVSASDENDASPTVVCVPPSGSFFPQGTTLVSCTATDDAGNESTCEFPVVVQPKYRER